MQKDQAIYYIFNKFNTFLLPSQYSVQKIFKDVKIEK